MNPKLWHKSLPEVLEGTAADLLVEVGDDDPTSYNQTNMYKKYQGYIAKINIFATPFSKIWFFLQYSENFPFSSRFPFSS